MQHRESWLNFPSHLDPPSTRSLSLLFILNEIRDSFEQIKIFKSKIESNPVFAYPEFDTFFSLNSSFPLKGMFPDKLCFYSNVLLQASRINTISLMKELDEIRISILQFRTHMMLLKRTQTAPLDMTKEALCFLTELHEKLRAFFASLIPFLQDARTDENVLLRLIEQRETFNHHVGPHCIDHILQRFFPNGHAHLRAIICEGFTRRGFTSFLSEKEHLIDEIEWENPCLATHD